MAIKAQIAKRVAVGLLSISAAGVASWQAHESFKPSPYIPTAGDVPTIGYGSTRYENGHRVKMGDQPISKERATDLARSLLGYDEQMFRSSIPGVELYQYEYDAYIDFVGQFGIGNWHSSSMRRELLRGNYKTACDSLLKWRFQAGRDCSLPENAGHIRGCAGVWTRQKERHQKCLGNI